jgi:hypothetical protein
MTLLGNLNWWPGIRTVERRQPIGRQKIAA